VKALRAESGSISRDGETRGTFPWGAASVTALTAAATSLRRIFDPDIFWHIRTGEWHRREFAGLLSARESHKK
jgi:hypothetical protein